MIMVLENISRHHFTLAKYWLEKEGTSTQSFLHSPFKRLHTKRKSQGISVVSNDFIQDLGYF